METPRPRVKWRTLMNEWRKAERGPRSDGRFDVRHGKIVALEEQRRSGQFGLGVGEAIAEIQLRGMLRPLAVAGERVQRAMRGAWLDRHEIDLHLPTIFYVDRPLKPLEV